MNARILRAGLLSSLAVVSTTLAACNGSGGGTSSPGSFQLESISVPEGAVWQINKRIELQFSDEVDLGTVIAGSTLQLSSIDGSGAAAFWDVGFKIDPLTAVVDKRTLVIQPFCPLLADLSDAGLQPGGIEYQLTVPKGGGGASSIKSVDGVPLKLPQTRHFTTPNSILPAVVFHDTQIGPPAFVPELTFVRLGDGQEVPFVFSGSAHELPITLPLNLYSDPDSQVEFLVQVNQAVSPAESNLNDSRVRIEYLDATGAWQAFQTLVELEANCRLDKPGAILRLKPLGILPQATELRVTIVAGFSDIVGEQNLSNQTDFFSGTEVIAFASLAPADGGADEQYEDFLVGGDAAGSFEDTGADFGAPGAVWGGGMLTAAFDFDGTGGPGGTFDWHSPIGNFNFSTDLQQITGGPDGIPAIQVQVVNGNVDVNDFVISAGSYVRVAPGKNPLTIRATGDVIIEGVLDASGYSAKEVGTLLTPHLPETGAVGAAGGGTGGTASYLTSASTPAGGNGDGPFGLKNAGGFGGETGYNPETDKQKRRGAGGGGGNFGAAVSLAGIPTGLSLAATDGSDGHPSGFGALTGESPPKGGSKGASPFNDASPNNDFFGQSAQYSGGILTGVTNGEVSTRLAGYGGGSGGDAIYGSSFPTIPFGPPYKDKKGAGGGGGGGQVRIVALGRIIFKKGGRILLNGGIGNTGENVLGYDHIAGSSGGGSGGHAFLESATQIDFTDGGVNQVSEQYVQSYGGDGGIGYTTGTPYSKGGDGGPGVVQLHVPDSDPATAVGTGPGSAIRLPLFGTISDVTRPPGLILVPTFGARSRARSVWISLGGADVSPSGGVDPVYFAFRGTDALGDGDLVTVDEGVEPLPAILGPETLGSAAPAPFVDVDGFTLVLSPGSLAPLVADLGTPSLDIYLRNPSLLTNFLLRLESVTTAKNFDVSSATYADGGGVLRVTTDAGGGSLAAFVTAQGGPAAVDYQLIPRFFRAQTGLVKDLIPDTGYVRVTFQATGLGIGGEPDEANPLVDWTPDITEFNTVPAGALKFYRWEVEFNLDSAGAGLTKDSIPISLEFLRTSFSF